jgi:S-layer protein (TIGR01567 family)
MMGLCILLVIVFAAISVHALEIRSSVAGTANGASNLFDNSYTWNSQNFVGFNYDIDHDVGSEILTTTLTEGNKLSGDAPYGIVYESSNRIKSLINAQVGMKYGKLSVRTIDTTTGTITLDNKDNAITLSKNKNTEIMPGIYIKTADNDKLRYYIYKNITNPGKYEIRSSVAGTVNGVSNLENGSYSWNRGSYTWNPQNFAGFYYDIKEDLGTENLKAVLADGSILSGDAPYGITYCTVAQSKSFKYGGWGIYSVIGFMGKEFFAGYFDSSDDTISVLYARSTDKNSLSSEQLEQILMDERTNLLIKKGESIKLKDGYELVLKGLNNEGQIYLELLKGGNKVDETYIAPSKILATEVDKTYCYRKDVGRQKNLVTIAVHFSSSYKDEERTLAAVDGIWQISDAPAEVKVDKKYDKMNIRSVDGTNGVIVMDNEGTTINLTRKTDVTLMPGINLRTAYNDTLRFYLYKTETVGSNTT